MEEFEFQVGLISDTAVRIAEALETLVKQGVERNKLLAESVKLQRDGLKASDELAEKTIAAFFGERL